MDGWMDGSETNKSDDSSVISIILSMFQCLRSLRPPHLCAATPLPAGLRVEALALFQRSYKGYLTIHAKDPTQVRSPHTTYHTPSP